MKREADTKREIVEKRNTNSFFFLTTNYTIQWYRLRKKNERISHKVELREAEKKKKIYKITWTLERHKGQESRMESH